ncbi:pilin [Cupriavidus metallidurans]|nr:pilin [Cupriavidus metallidurans]
MAAGKTPYELAVVNSGTIAVPGDIGLQTATGNCSAISVTAPAGTPAVATGAIKCTVASPGRLGTAGSVFIQYDRDAAGLYTCVVTGVSNAAYKPAGC